MYNLRDVECLKCHGIGLTAYGQCKRCAEHHKVTVEMGIGTKKHNFNFTEHCIKCKRHFKDCMDRGMVLENCIE